MNNWAVELEQFNLKMEWIQGSKNTLADSLSCLLEVVPETKLEKEPEGQEFSCYCFEDLAPVCTEYIEEIGELTMCENVKVIRIPLKPEQLKEIQKRDTYCRDIVSKLQKGPHMNKIFVMENGVLY